MLLWDFHVYLEDMQDHVNQAMDEMRRLTDVCDALLNEFQLFGEQQMNRTLYVLTVVTTVFIPGQFLTGMYGMNFVTANGTPGIPELVAFSAGEGANEYGGYIFFWCAFIILTVSLACAFRCNGLLEAPGVGDGSSL